MAQPSLPPCYPPQALYTPSSGLACPWQLLLLVGVSVAEAAVLALAKVASAQALTLDLHVPREAYWAARLPPFSQLSGLTTCWSSTLNMSVPNSLTKGVSYLFPSSFLWQP